MTDEEEIATARALQDRIEAAFLDVPYPGDENISTCPEGGGPAQDYEEIAEAFIGKKWQDWKDSPLSLIGAPEIEQGALAFLDPGAFRYYLPLFLIAATRYYEQANLIPGNVVTAFMPGKEEGTRSLRDERFPLLTLEQFETVKACLGFMKSAYGAEFLDDEIDLAIRNIDREISRRAQGASSSNP